MQQRSQRVEDVKSLDVQAILATMVGAVQAMDKTVRQSCWLAVAMQAPLELEVESLVSF
eukprot:SAG31_NODE_1517_length_8031_cov_18.008699_6_plen_59_part_00